MHLSEFYKTYSGTFVVGLAAEEIYSYVRDMRSKTVNVALTIYNPQLYAYFTSYC
jgi:hypothetical protein